MENQKVKKKSASPVVKTPTFSYTKLGDQPPNYNNGYLINVHCNGRRVCQRQHWALASCGLSGLARFSDYGGLFSVGDDLDEFFRFLNRAVTKVEDHYIDEWRAGEFIFALSDPQTESFKALVSHPQVRLLDRWYNKAHGPNHMHLYKLSLPPEFE